MQLYSLGEHKLMAAFHRRKDAFLAPLVRALQRAKISADTVSGISALITPTILIVSLASARPGIFIFGLALHLFLDALDGALARANKSNKTNAVADAAADHIALTCAALFVWLIQIVDASTILAYYLTYTVVVIFAFWRSYLKIPYALLLRSRLPFYLFLTIDFFLGLHLTAALAPLGIVANLIFIVAGLTALTRFYLKR